MSILSDLLLESKNINENIKYNIKDNLDGLPKGVELKDKFKFSSKTNFSDRHPSQIITEPFSYYDEAEEFCIDNNIDPNNIKESSQGDIFIEYTKNYDVVPIRYNITCTINQYEGKNIVNKFDNFPLTVTLDVLNFSNKEIITSAKMRYNNISFPNNVGVDTKSIKINSYIFEIREK